MRRNLTYLSGSHNCLVIATRINGISKLIEVFSPPLSMPLIKALQDWPTMTFIKRVTHTDNGGQPAQSPKGCEPTNSALNAETDMLDL